MHNELPSYDQAPAGAIRFNTDSNKLEVYIGGPVGYGTLPNGQWMQVDNWSPENQTGGTRGIFAGGVFPTPSASNIIQYVNIDSTGNAIDFGDLLTGRRGGAGCASRTRGIHAGGRETPTPGTSVRVSKIDFITIASTGNGQNFGNLSQARESLYGCSSETRGIFAGGYTPTQVDTIDYITIASDGVTAQDFGNLTDTRRDGTACASSTRGLFVGGYKTSPTMLNTIEFVTISTLGNSADFGDLTAARRLLGGASNSIRGLFAGGGPEGGPFNTIDYVSIPTLGNAIDFGDLTVARREVGAASSPTRMVIAQGANPSNTDVNIIDYVQIMSTGNAVDFGDTIDSKVGGLTATFSNGHGGL